MCSFGLFGSRALLEAWTLARRKTSSPAAPEPGSPATASASANGCREGSHGSGSSSRSCRRELASSSSRSDFASASCGVGLFLPAHAREQQPQLVVGLHGGRVQADRLSQLALRFVVALSAHQQSAQRLARRRVIGITLTQLLQQRRWPRHRSPDLWRRAPGSSGTQAGRAAAEGSLAGGRPPRAGAPEGTGPIPARTAAADRRAASRPIGSSRCWAASNCRFPTFAAASVYWYAGSSGLRAAALASAGSASSSRSIFRHTRPKPSRISGSSGSTSCRAHPVRERTLELALPLGDRRGLAQRRNRSGLSASAAS